MPSPLKIAYLLSAIVLSAAVLAGCAASPSAAPEPVRESAEVSPAPTPPVGEAAINAAHVCGQATTLMTMMRNAADGYRLGKVDATAYVADLTTVATGFRHVLQDDSDVATQVGELVAYLDAATPTEEGAPFDPDAEDWGLVVAQLSAACNSAGSSLTALLDNS